MADEIKYDSTQPVRSQQSATYTPTGLNDQNNLNAYNAQREQQIGNVYDKALASTKQGLKTAYDQNLSDLQAARDKISPQYQQSANALASEYERQKRNTNMQGAANGLNTGAGSQLALGQSVAYQRNAGNLARSENEALNEANRGIANLGVQYQNQIAQAVANNDYKLAQSMLDEYENQYNRQRTLENENYQRALQAEQQAYQRAYQEENRDYGRAYDIENRDYNRNWNVENRDYDRAWNQDQRDYERNRYADETAYNRAWNEEQRGYNRYWDENDRAYNRNYNEENRDYQRAWDTENRDYTRDWNQNERDYSRAYNEENRDYTRNWNTENRDYERAYNEENRDYTRAWNQDERDYTRGWNEDERGYDRQMTEAANRAEYGDFSGYASVYGQGVADAMRDIWVAQNPMVAYHTGAITADEYMMLTGKYPYNYGGSSGGSSYSSYGRGGGGGYGSGGTGGTGDAATLGELYWGSDNVTANHSYSQNLESQLAQIRDNSTGSYQDTMADMNAYAKAYAQAAGGGQAQQQYASVLADTVMNGMNGEFAPNRAGTPTAAEIAATKAKVAMAKAEPGSAAAAAAKYQADGAKKTAQATGGGKR